jgi:DNA-binding IclR family transcriptional regulator
VVAVVDALARAESGGIGVRDLAARIGISRSAVHRVLAHLTTLGYATLLPHERYEAGALTLGWAAMLAEQHSFQTAVEGELASLVGQFDESAYALEYDPTARDLVVVAGAQTSQPVRYLLEIGSRAQLYAGAAGKAVLAFLGPDTIDELKLQRLTSSTIVSKSMLKADLAAVAERGYAVSQGERISDASGIAAPVFAGPDVVGAITLTVPHYRYSEATVAERADAVMAAAAGASRLLFPQNGSRP